MAAPDYAKTQNERLWFVDETTFNTLAQPTSSDAVIPLPGVTIPPALREFTPSVERSPSAGIRSQIKRKKRPSEFSVPVYVKAQDAAGTAPSYGLALKKGMGTETIAGGVSVKYTLATAIEETSLSIWHFIDNMLRGMRGCLINTIGIELSGSEEGRITLAGFAANEVFAGVGALAASMTIAQTTLTLGAGEARRYQVGPDANDTIRIKIDSEVMLVTAVNYTTDVLTITRAQDGTTAATHATNAEVAPSIPGTDPGAADLIQPIVLGQVDVGALTDLRTVSFAMEINNQLEPRIDEYAEDTATGFRRTGKRTVTGTLRGYSRKQMQALLTDLERELEENTVVTAGSVGTGAARLKVTVPKLKFNAVTIDSGGPEFQYELGWQGFESSVGNDEVELLYE